MLQTGTPRHNITQQQPAEHAYASYNQQPAYRGAVHVPPQDHHSTIHATIFTDAGVYALEAAAILALATPRFTDATG